MKKINIYLLIGLAATLSTSCADLDTEYLGGAVSTTQKESTLEYNPSMGTASVTGMFTDFAGIFKISSNAHIDFGYPSVMIGLDSQGMDYTSKNSGYNWYSSYNGYSNRSTTGWPDNMMWMYNYAQINICNTILPTIPADTDNNTLKFYRAQALAVRAFDYWTLIQVYQYNYDGYADAPGVCLLTDENIEEVAENGAPRATVAEIYDQILKDLNEAVSLLEGNPVTADQIISDKPKRMVSLAVAYGLRARVYLTMHKYADAANDAQRAIAAFSGRPYSIEEVSKPGFTSMSDASWMWGIANAETDDWVANGSIVNFPAMSCTFSHGYCDQGGAWRWASRKLYDMIPATDVRKGWWLDENRKSANLNAAQQAYIDSFDKGTPNYGADATANMMPYTNVKFDSYQSVLSQSINAADVPMMRVEEMYLILAEGQAMSGNTTGGLETLTNFVKTYRNPEYVTTASTAEAIQEEVWNQRRIELWGEGLSYFDIMRLHKDIDRRGCAFPAAWVYVIKYGEKGNGMLYMIPEEEVSTNKAFTGAGEKDDFHKNNPAITEPNPVAEN